MSDLICASPVISADSAAFLEILIEEHHQQFVGLYPEESVIPKMHIMIHFPQQILNYGPLVHTWTMRHEAKLRVIKRAARVSNFKNVCQTVAKRHQHLLCFYLHSNLLDKPVKTGPCKTLSYITQSECVQSILREQYQLTNECALFTTSFLIYNGVTFKPNAFVVLSYDVLLPTFCKIRIRILIVNREIFLIMNEYTTQYFDSHYHAYCICEPQYIPSKFHKSPIL